MTPIKDITRGRWRHLLPGYGVGAEYLTGRHGPCPLCKEGKDRFRFDDKGDGMWFCTHCGAGDGVSLVMKMAGLDFKEAVADLTRRCQGAPVTPDRQKAGRTAEDRTQAMNRLWALGQPLKPGDPVWRYLTGRGIGVAGVNTRELRCVPQARFYPDPKDRSRTILLPAMLAKVRDADGKAVNIHRTFLTEDGSGKAPYPDNRKLMAGALPQGSAIRLGRAPDDGRLGVAEGIETAMSAWMMFGVPTWAAINADNLMAFRPVEGLTTYIFGDADRNYVGQAAAFTLAKRLTLKNEHAAVVYIPPELGTDWNDRLNEGRQVA